MDIDQRTLGQLRRNTGEVGNHVIDEFTAGHLSRREFLRRGTIVGMSLPLLGGILAACGSSSSTPTTTKAGGGGSSGATINAGIIVPTGDINPVTVSDQGGLDMLAQTGEYLCLSDQNLKLQPVLATSWSSNSAGDVWTFKIRSGVKFHNGQPLTADDVVYTYKLQSEPTGKSNALSAFTGVLTPSGVTKVDAQTVQFHLAAPNGNFP
jgi:peptide/nickel transport system substrate-binding protein